MNEVHRVVDGVRPRGRSAPASLVATLLRRLAALWLGLALLAGCAALPAGVQRTTSTALADNVGTSLGRTAAASMGDVPPDLSGFRLLPEGPEAFELRLALARRAQQSLDVQYYLIANDASGRQFVNELALAAGRGVRVRLLVDDLHAADQDDAFTQLARRRNVEVRLFNPLPVRDAGWATRLLFSLHEFERVNRRMHNKLFIADNAWAVTGGRNIGDEYFMRSDAYHFVDMDVLAAGPVVRELSAHFDAFWNSEYAYPIESLLAASAGAMRVAPLADSPGHVGAAAARAADAGAAADGEPGVVAELARGSVELHAAAAQVFADLPAKAAVESATLPLPTAMDSALKLFLSARSEVHIVSPYFIPGERGLEKMRSAAQGGIRVSVMTNSLAATDEPLAYWGFRRYRHEMLRLGVTLTEMSPAPGPRAGVFGRYRASLGRLHAKLATVDQRWVLIGSMNMDARSSRTNTELSVLIDSAGLARELAAALNHDWAANPYRLRLADAERAVEWIDTDGAGELHRSEPHVNWLARLRLGLMSMFVPEELL